MKVTAHFAHPASTSYPSRDWIMAHVAALGFSLTPSEYNKVRRDAVLSEEIIPEGDQAYITYSIDHEELEFDYELQDFEEVWTRNTVMYL